MGKLKDKVVGKTKQAVAEIIGDGKSNEEGKEQARRQSGAVAIKTSRTKTDHTKIGGAVIGRPFGVSSLQARPRVVPAAAISIR